MLQCVCSLTLLLSSLQPAIAKPTSSPVLIAMLSCHSLPSAPRRLSDT